MLCTDMQREDVSARSLCALMGKLCTRKQHEPLFDFEPRQPAPSMTEARLDSSRIKPCEFHNINL